MAIVVPSSGKSKACRGLSHLRRNVASGKRIINRIPQISCVLTPFEIRLTNHVKLTTKSVQQYIGSATEKYWATVFKPI
ncbi:unnamed protein product, partial [Iphiclides podalirius]